MDRNTCYILSVAEWSPKNLLVYWVQFDSNVIINQVDDKYQSKYYRITVHCGRYK